MIDLASARRLTREESAAAGVSYSAKRYTDASGRIFSYREYLNARARARGFASEWARAKHAAVVERAMRGVETPGLSPQERKEYLRLLKNTPALEFAPNSPRKLDPRLRELARKLKASDEGRYYATIRLLYR